MSCVKPVRAYLVDSLDGELKLVFGKAPAANVTIYSQYDLPCGKCLECRRITARDWTTRLVAEMSTATCGLSLLLTYDDYSLPRMAKSGLPTLYPQDVSIFMKRLRSKANYWLNCDNLRFFCAGEYGRANGRPHYHLIIFGLDIDFAKEIVYARTEKGTPIYDELRQLPFDIAESWSHGHVTYSPMTISGIAYTAQYLLDYDKQHHLKGTIPSFRLMSRKPGIGTDFLSKNIKLLLDGYLFTTDTYTAPLPAFFKKKMKEYDPITMHRKVVESRALAEITLANKLSALGISAREYELHQYYNDLHVNDLRSQSRTFDG